MGRAGNLLADDVAHHAAEQVAINGTLEVPQLCDDGGKALVVAKDGVISLQVEGRGLSPVADVYIEAGRVLMGMGLKKKMKEMTFDE